MALADYGGTIVFVSHSRTFVNAVATKILEVKDGTVRQYPRTYEEYVASLEDVLDADVAGDAKNIKAPGADEEARQRYRMELKELNRQANAHEKRVAVLDKRKSELLQYFFDNPTDYAPDKNRELQEVTELMKQEEEQWMKALQKLEQLQS